ncbi:phage holin family protein [Paraburkholderia sp.]|uniref:phage holin family protein n=1 Tax=Paraburkholderia sp. TaxID=1926495 RepID=UPI00239E702D|nr:phage holin family protein [Paraburkholderia sp.]MDE1181771.1 phage holin family protein [Paraburkholderia sp.]
MSIRSKITQWRNVGRFVSRRVPDYGELLAIELAEAKTLVVRELIALMTLVVGALFTLSFVCVAVIITTVGTPYFRIAAWAIAGVWLVVSLLAFVLVRAQRPVQPFRILQAELNEDLKTVKEALK